MIQIYIIIYLTAVINARCLIQFIYPDKVLQKFSYVMGDMVLKLSMLRIRTKPVLLSKQEEKRYSRLYLFRQLQLLIG